MTTTRLAAALAAVTVSLALCQGVVSLAQGGTAAAPQLLAAAAVR